MTETTSLSFSLAGEAALAAVAVETVLNQQLQAEVPLMPWPEDACEIAHEEAVFGRLLRDTLDNQPEKVRMSYGSNCDRRLWYCAHEAGEAGKNPEDVAQMRLRTFQGHAWEAFGLVLLEGGLAESPMFEFVDAGQRLLRMRLETGYQLEGHIDGMLRSKRTGQVFIMDFKFKGEWIWRSWELTRDGHAPGELWGERYQAGLYTMALVESGEPVGGFLWPTLVDYRNGPRVECAWATRALLDPWGREALEKIVRVFSTDTPPAPVNPGRDASPCRGKTKVYCPFWQFCKEDHR